MPHLDEGALHALVDGEIPSSDLPPLQGHLASCASCRAALEEARALAGEALDLVESLEVPEVSSPHSGPDPRPSPRATALPWRRLAWAATVVISLGVGYGVRDILPPPTDPTEMFRETDAQTDAGVLAPAPSEQQSLEQEDQAKEEAAPSRPATDREPQAKVRAPETAAPSPRAKATVDDSASTPVVAIPPVAGRNALDAVTSFLRDVPAAPPPTQQARLSESRREAPTADVGAGVRVRASTAATEEDAVTLDEAMRWSAGRLRLLPDLVPAGVNRRGDTLRVTYLLGTRVVVLEEIFRPDTVLVHFRVKPDFPADSLAALRARLP